MNRRGAGLVEVLIGFAVVSMVSAMSYQLLGQSNSQAAGSRKYRISKKSFGGAEQILINQRQCRCNFMNKAFDATVPTGTKVTLTQIKTFENVDDCPLVAGPNDEILSDTLASANSVNRSAGINLVDFKMIIPSMLYRATLKILPDWGAPVSFPLLLNTSAPDKAGQVTIQICGVDRET